MWKSRQRLQMRVTRHAPNLYDESTEDPGKSIKTIMDNSTEKSEILNHVPDTNELGHEVVLDDSCIVGDIATILHVETEEARDAVSLSRIKDVATTEACRENATISSVCDDDYDITMNEETNHVRFIDHDFISKEKETSQMIDRIDVWPVKRPNHTIDHFRNDFATSEDNGATHNEVSRTPEIPSCTSPTLEGAYHARSEDTDAFNEERSTSTTGFNERYLTSFSHENSSVIGNDGPTTLDMINDFSTGKIWEDGTSPIDFVRDIFNGGIFRDLFDGSDASTDSVPAQGTVATGQNGAAPQVMNDNCGNPFFSEANPFDTDHITANCVDSLLNLKNDKNICDYNLAAQGGTTTMGSKSRHPEDLNSSKQQDNASDIRPFGIDLVNGFWRGGTILKDIFDGYFDDAKEAKIVSSVDNRCSGLRSHTNNEIPAKPQALMMEGGHSDDKSVMSAGSFSFRSRTSSLEPTVPMRHASLTEHQRPPLDPQPDQTLSPLILRVPGRPKQKVVIKQIGFNKKNGSPPTRTVREISPSKYKANRSADNVANHTPETSTSERRDRSIPRKIPTTKRIPKSRSEILNKWNEKRFTRSTSKRIDRVPEVAVPRAAIQKRSIPATQEEQSFLASARPNNAEKCNKSETAEHVNCCLFAHDETQSPMTISDHVEDVPQVDGILDFCIHMTDILVDINQSVISCLVGRESSSTTTTTRSTSPKPSRRERSVSPSRHSKRPQSPNHSGKVGSASRSPDRNRERRSTKSPTRKSNDTSGSPAQTTSTRWGVSKKIITTTRTSVAKKKTQKLFGRYSYFQNMRNAL